jgi:hypothetical protein
LRTGRLAAALVATSLALAGCGGDDEAPPADGEIGGARFAVKAAEADTLVPVDHPSPHVFVVVEVTATGDEPVSVDARQLRLAVGEDYKDGADLFLNGLPGDVADLEPGKTAKMHVFFGGVKRPADGKADLYVFAEGEENGLKLGVDIKEAGARSILR